MILSPSPIGRNLNNFFALFYFNEKKIPTRKSICARYTTRSIHARFYKVRYGFRPVKLRGHLCWLWYWISLSTWDRNNKSAVAYYKVIGTFVKSEKIKWFKGTRAIMSTIGVVGRLIFIIFTISTTCRRYIPHALRADKTRSINKEIWSPHQSEKFHVFILTDQQSPP